MAERYVQETISERIKADPAFRDALLAESVQCLLDNDVATGTAILRSLVEATVGMPRLARRAKLNVTDLERVLAPEGDPSARELFRVVAALTPAKGPKLRVTMEAA